MIILVGEEQHGEIELPFELRQADRSDSPLIGHVSAYPDVVRQLLSSPGATPLYLYTPASFIA